MKFSKFNTVVPYKGKYIYHNSFKESFLLLEPVLIDLIEAAKNENNIIGIKEVHPDLFKSLIENGFIIPKSEDEILKVHQLIKEVDINDELFDLMIMPTMNCNFKCWYCYEDHIKGSKISSENIGRIKLLIENKLKDMENLKFFHLSFFGGEPLLYFKDVILPIMKFTYNTLSKKNISLYTHFTTNGLLINEEMLKCFVDFKVNSFQITLDGNRKNHDLVRFVSKTKGSYDTIVSNIKKLVKNNIEVTLRINYTVENIDGLYDILEDFKDLSVEYRKRIMLSMNKVWQEKSDLYEKSKKFSLVAKKFGFKIPSANRSNTLRNSCYADKKYQAVINYNGDIYKCNARNFTEENKEGILLKNGEIKWNKKFTDRINIKLKNKPCLECSILPICGGACSQYALDHKDEDYCIRDFDESRKKELILEMFLSEQLKYA